MLTGDETWLYLCSKPGTAAWLRPEGQRQQICKMGFQSKGGLFSALLSYQGRADLEMAVVNETHLADETNSDKLRAEKG